MLVLGRELEDDRPDRLDHRLSGGTLGERLTQVVECSPDVVKDKVLFAGEVPIEGAMRDLGRGGDLVHRDGVESPFEEQPRRHLDDLGAGALLLALAQSGGSGHGCSIGTQEEESGTCVNCVMCR